LSETCNGVTVSSTFGVLALRTNLAVQVSGSTISSVTSGYDPASRLQSVAAGGNAASYGYVGSAALVQDLTT
jgi:hypothetical protein